MRVDVQLCWKPFGVIEHDGAPLVVNPSLEAKPGVYQLVFRHDRRERRYIGEAENLKQRFIKYCSPGVSQSTNRRMNDRARRVLHADGRVEILLASDIRFTVDGTEYPADLESPFSRRFIENAALVELLTTNSGIVNGKGYGDCRLDEVLA